MLIIKPDSMPRLWWLFPWSYARQLYHNAQALKALCDRQDDLLRGKYTPRPRWKLLPHDIAEGQTAYYFNDTDSPYYRAKSDSPYRGKCLLYDGPSKSYVYETDPAKAIARVTELNAQ
jgi:hypothetical protein